MFQANLTALGLHNLGGIKEELTPRQGGPPDSSVPEPRPELFYRGQPMTLARWYRTFPCHKFVDLKYLKVVDLPGQI